LTFDSDVVLLQFGFTFHLIFAVIICTCSLFGVQHGVIFISF